MKELLYPFQHGFQKGRSRVAQLLEAFYDISGALDRGIETDIIYLDFAKAFDSVCPAKLVSKLSTFGIKDPLLTWFHSYLTGRSQRVVINGTSSRWTDVGSGVPQGSQLGPILFLLFVNDMPNVVTSATLAMFADDSKCYKVTNHHSDYLHLQQDLDALSNWSLRNELFFQPTKCSNLRISRKRLSPPRSYVLNGINVEVVTAEKDLGIMIANDTSWKHHLVMIVAKAKRMLGFLKRNCAGIVGSTVLLRLYCSLVRSHFCFCSQLWAPQSSTSNLILFENIRRRATHFILRNSNLCYKAHLIKLKLLPLSYWLEYLDLVFFFKCLHGLIDFTHEFSNYFSFLKGNTRCASSGLHLKLNAFRTSSFRDFYFNRITLMWNSLPKNIKDSDTISSFKSKLKSFYFTKLLNAFDRDNFRSFKLICPKCRSVNTSSVSTC